jgi:indole-3-glycerol phosphate synthase
MLGRNPVEYALQLADAGAPVISVVTEPEHFGGSLELLQEIAQRTSLPILRKDFIKTREELVKSVDMGARAVLLISSILEKEQLISLIEESIALGLEPLVETHNEKEMKAVKEMKLSFVGINNRNILEWEMDNGNVHTTENLANYLPQGAFVLSESSIASPIDVERAVSAGAHGVLVGTAILKAEDPVDMYQKLCVARRQ